MKENIESFNRRFGFREGRATLPGRKPTPSSTPPIPGLLEISKISWVRGEIFEENIHLDYPLT